MLIFIVLLKSEQFNTILFRLKTKILLLFVVVVVVVIDMLEWSI